MVILWLIAFCAVVGFLLRASDDLFQTTKVKREENERFERSAALERAKWAAKADTFRESNGFKSH